MDHTIMYESELTCPKNDGMLPSCAALANPYVPYQQDDSQPYQPATGLIRGTIYPGLDLPFMGMINKKELNSTLMHQIQAMQFSLQELGLYLDTHKNDKDALELFNQYVEQIEMLIQKYSEAKGPLYKIQSGTNGVFQWVEGPWPWSYEANSEV